MVDLNYDTSSLCGPVDMRVARFLEEDIGNQLDPSYVAHILKWHGGIPGNQYFDAGDGKTYRVGRFLTLVDKRSELEPPPRPSWSFPRDARIDWSVLTLIDQEGPSCRHLFAGEELLPFAALYWGPHHPDGMRLTDGDVNLVAFLYESEPRPRVVVWLAHEAQKEYWRWENALRASGWNEEEPVRYQDFTVPVAPSFDAFLTMLRAKP
jgi:hypothetical protein